MGKDYSRFFSEEDFDDTEGEDFLRRVKPNRKPVPKNKIKPKKYPNDEGDED